MFLANGKTTSSMRIFYKCQKELQARCFKSLCETAKHLEDATRLPYKLFSRTSDHYEVGVDVSTKLKHVFVA